MMPMKNYRCVWLAILGFIGFSALPIAAKAQNANNQNASDVVTPAKVELAIEKCVSYLKSQQDKSNGKWDGYPDYATGQTALVTLALLSAGESPKDPAVALALEYLRQRPPVKTYEAALQTMVFCAAEPNRDMALIRRNVEWLVKAQRVGGIGSVGSWSYDQNIGRGDPSNSQFALLALWEAQRIGVQVPKKTLEAARTYWLNTQWGVERNSAFGGGWDYAEGGTDLSGSMTAAGIASLLIADDALFTADAAIRDGKLQCCLGSVEPTRVDLAMGWLTRNFSVTRNPSSHPTEGKPNLLYYLYALERVGRLTGSRLIGNHDWYREGSEVLLRMADRFNGSIRGLGGLEEDTITGTSFGLLFLSKGKRQIVIGRLDYRQSPQDTIDWVLHRRAVQNLTGHIERAWKRDLAWQTVQISGASVADLMECPVIFISGRSGFPIDQGQRVLLKKYVDQGGFLFVESCNGDGCDGRAFDAEFKQFVQDAFGQPLQRLPPSHPIWFAESRVDPASLPENFWLLGLEQCCRTSIVYSPSSLSCRWELFRPQGIQPDYPENVRKDLENATKIGINVASYATGKELKEKLDRPTVLEPTADLAPTVRGTFALPKLQHAGGANDVPRAITNLLTIMKKEISGVDISTQPILISPIASELEKHTIVYIHGRNTFAFNDEQRLALRSFFDHGGILLGDAICASQEFATALRDELGAIVPDSTLQRVPVDHPMLTQEYNGFDIRNVTLLDPNNQEGKAIQFQRREGPPVLEILVRNGRVLAIFSPYDLSCALESRGSTQCRGYPTDDAAKIASNMILYSLFQ